MSRSPSEDLNPGSEGAASSPDADGETSRQSSPQQIHPTGVPQEDQSNARPSRHPQVSKPRPVQTARKQIHRKSAYRDLLNKDIERVNGESAAADGDVLAESQTGASFWNAREKDALFRRLASRGPGNFPSLCQAVPSKSESEIRTYLTLLREGAAENAPSSELNIGEIPAANEVPENLESAFDVAADGLEAYVDKHEMNLERQRYGDEYWLIDNQIAEQLEGELDDAQDGPLQEGDEGQGTPTRTEHHNKAVGEDQSSHPISPTTLLRPTSFLQLSKDCFMNNSADDALNWHLLDNKAAASEEPAIYRSAFEEFHNLAVSATRRLVQAAIFQCTSRLRAQDSSRPDWTPVASVREVDVRSALNIIGTASWRDYWIKVPRRNQLQVTTESKRYADGRPTTTVGIRGQTLSYDEVEAELGSNAGVSQDDMSGIDPEVDEEDVDDMMMNSDLFTDDDTDQGSKTGGSNADSRNLRSRKRSRKRKRALSPSNFYRAENVYLETLDINASLRDEHQVRKTLGIKLRDEPVTPVKSSSLPGPTPEAENAYPAWRDDLKYEAEWENALGPVTAEAFEEVGLRGVARRKRRCVLERRVRMRLHEQGTGQAGSNILDDDHSDDDLVDVDADEGEESGDAETGASDDHDVESPDQTEDNEVGNISGTEEDQESEESEDEEAEPSISGGDA